MANVQQRTNKKCGYCGYILPDSYILLNHSCFHPFDEDIHRLKIDENLVVTVVSVEEEIDNSKDLSNNDNFHVDIDELLIQHVSQRRPLFDHRIPTSDRSTLKKNALWQEVCNSLGETLSVTDIKKRWRYLRDCFMKAKKKKHTYIPSGSAADNLTKRNSSFRFYEHMKFLDDVLGKSPTCSSISSNVQNNEEVNENTDEANAISISVPQPTCSSVSNSSLLSSSTENSDVNSSKKRKCDKSSKINEEFHEAVITALRETHQPDGVDGFLLLLGEGLRKLPYRERTKLEMKFLTMLTEEQDKLNDLLL